MMNSLKVIMTTKTLLQFVIILTSLDFGCAQGVYPSYIDQLRGCESNGPLGMITGHIQDWQITASSTYPRDWDKACHERFARVYQPNGVAWCAKHKSASEWLQVDLGLPGKVTGLMTQGRGDGTEWVVAYQISYSLDAFHWQYIYDQYGNQRVFDGNTDSYHVKHVYLDEPIIARYIKFHTARWNRHPSMRVEIIGCQVCNSHLALPPYGKLTASSERNQHTGSSCQAEDGHLLTQKGWCAKDNNNNQWLQFDVGPPTLITGFVTKGRGEPGRKHWVTRYRLSYSNDTSIWFFYKDATHLEIKRPPLSWNKGLARNATISYMYVVPDRQSPEGLEFGGNMDKDTARYHYLSSPFVSRYVRFHPVEWNTHIGMRAGLIGCSHQGDCGPGFLRVVNNTPCVQNLAYKKDSWINNKRQFKRHVRNQWTRGQAGRAVDGDVNSPTCTVLDNYFVDKPTWMVDLGKRTKISGVRMITRQGKDPDQRSTDHVYNLDKLTIYVDNMGGKENIEQPENICGFVSRVNDAIFQEQLHVQCSGPMRGRYVYVEATGVATRWTRLFSAVICEVLIYE